MTIAAGTGCPPVCRILTPLLAMWLARRLGLRAGDVGCHLAHEFLKVAQALRPVGGYRVSDPDVAMHKYVVEPDGLAHRDGQLG